MEFEPGRQEQRIIDYRTLLLVFAMAKGLFCIRSDAAGDLVDDVLVDLIHNQGLQIGIAAIVRIEGQGEVPWLLFQPTKEGGSARGEETGRTNKLTRYCPRVCKI